MMLNSTLRSVAAGTAIFGLSVMGWFTLSNQESEAYSPRLEEKAAEPNGALEIRQALLGDENGVVDYAGCRTPPEGGKEGQARFGRQSFKPLMARTRTRQHRWRTRAIEPSAPTASTPVRCPADCGNP